MSLELLDFTRQALAKGIERPKISAALHQAGWAEADIAAALGAFADINFEIPVPRPKPYLSARDSFLHLIMFSALYVCAYNLGSMAFNFIDRAFPDPLQARYFRDFASTIRWDVASLIVGFPLFLFTFRLITKAIAKDPSKRSSRPRKWLTYLTLLIAALTLTGDLVTLVYNVLGGEFTTRFALKVVTVAVIAGGTFAYFFAGMRQEEGEA